MATIRLDVEGEPVGQGSMRHIGGGRMIAANDKALKVWRKAIAAAAPSMDPLGSAVRVDVVFYVSRKPKDKKGEFPVHPYDLDKLCRAVGDALSIDSQILENDSQIVEWHAVKCFADLCHPGAVITVTEL